MLGNSKAKIGGAIIVTKKAVCLDRTLEWKVIIMLQWSGDTETFLSIFWARATPEQQTISPTL